MLFEWTGGRAGAIFVRLAIVSVTTLLAACLDEAKPEVIELPQAASPQAQLMQAKCGSCHAVPQPKIHPAEFWPGVVYRMQLHMKTKGIESLSDAEMSMVINYLQGHAGEKEK